MASRTPAGPMIAEAFVALYAGHMVADHWVQTDHQAMNKEERASSCWAHVCTYVGTVQLFLTVAFLVTGDWPGSWQMIVGALVTFVTHYWADRRKPLRRLAAALGKGDYWDRGGAYQLDQSWHIAWLFVHALILAA